jgi:hypothetical protein
VFRKAVIATVVGSTCGAVAGYWSRPADIQHDPPAVAAPAAPIAVAAGPVSRLPAEAALVQPLPHAKQQARTEPAPRGLDDSRDAVQHARVLAQRPDVRGLIALREAVLRRAEVSGGKESPAAKRQLDEIDRYLTEARVLQLKRDAAGFRNGAADGVPMK